jgi:PadR family transcriptional regulator, regulatory protein PadR
LQNQSKILQAAPTETESLTIREVRKKRPINVHTSYRGRTWIISICIIYFLVYIEEIRTHNYLGEFELILLLTLIRLGDEAYGVPLSKELALMRGRDVSIGSVYAALDRLELKGLVASSLGESTPERGGRAKRYFRVTEQGLRSVQETRKVLSKLWKSLPSVKEDLA